MKLHSRDCTVACHTTEHGETEQFKRFLDEEHPGKSAGGFSKTFAKGVSKFIEKVTPLSLTEKDNVQKILKNLDDMVETFGKIIERSIKEFKK